MGAGGVPARTTRNSALPQRMQLVRESRAVVDITIPHEHSITGMATLLYKWRCFSRALAGKKIPSCR